MLKVIRSRASTWTLVVPVKTLVAAKTRLSAAAGPHRAALAVAIACDTVEAALSCVLVARVVVVTGDPVAAEALGGVGAHVVGDPEAGLNAALRRGAREAVRLAPADAVGALQADLPALRPAELALVLTAAAEFDQMFLPDAVEVGTTFYGVRPGVPFTPGFGGESRDSHLRRWREGALPGRDRLGPAGRGHPRRPPGGTRPRRRPPHPGGGGEDRGRGAGQVSRGAPSASAGGGSPAVWPPSVTKLDPGRGAELIGLPGPLVSACPGRGIGLLELNVRRSPPRRASAGGRRRGRSPAASRRRSRGRSASPR